MTGPGGRRPLEPRNLAVAGRELAIAWGDGHESYFPFADLRTHCPCAVCRSAASRGVPGPPVETLEIARLRPVGAYAVQIVWSDGHDSGIFAFEHLRRACPCGECASLEGAGW